MQVKTLDNVAIHRNEKTYEIEGMEDQEKKIFDIIPIKQLKKRPQTVSTVTSAAGARIQRQRMQA